MGEASGERKGVLEQMEPGCSPVFKAQTEKKGTSGSKAPGSPKAVGAAAGGSLPSKSKSPGQAIYGALCRVLHTASDARNSTGLRKQSLWRGEVCSVVIWASLPLTGGAESRKPMPPPQTRPGRAGELSKPGHQTRSDPPGHFRS